MGPGKGLEEAKNRSAPHPGKRVWEGLQSSNQGVLKHGRDCIKITNQNHNKDWVKALNEPLIMSTAPLRTTGEDHLVETGFVTRK